MKKETSRQKEYLLLFAERIDDGRSVTSVSETLGVAKATASVLSKALEKMGYLRKDTVGHLMLTEKGAAYAEPMLKQMRQIETWMVSALGLSPKLADREARRLVVTMDHDTIEGIIRSWNGEVDHYLVKMADRFFRSLPQGAYEVPFQLYKKDTQELSMGDRGFRKPAVLVREKYRCFFLLQPLEICCSVNQSPRLDKGTVKQLWYCSENTWHDVREYRDGSGYLIPASAVHHEESQMGRVRIWVRPTVSPAKMPESEADLVFQLNAARPCKF